MKKIIAFVFCGLLVTTSVNAARLPRVLKMPKTCKVVKFEKDGNEKSYFLKCKKPLSKRMRGWVFEEKTRYDRRQERTWRSRRGNWRIFEESICRLKTCKAKRIIVFNVVGC